MEQHNTGTVKDLAGYRLSTAEEDIKDARTLFDTGAYRASNNRAYYSIFHAINAIHILNGASYKKHKDAIANFNKEYVRTEIFPRIIGRKIARAEEIRHASDYDDFYIATREEAGQMIETAEEFLSMAREYCKEIMDGRGTDE